MKIARILVALDSSPRAPFVLEAAMSLARSHGGKLVLFRAVGIQPDIPTVVYVSPNDLGALLLERERESLRELAAAIPADLLEAVHVEVGVPWQAICEAAKARMVDLVVLGSHGYGVLDRVLGTTAAKVVNHADRSTLVVRPTPTDR